MEPPATIHGFAVVEYGYFSLPILPIGYLPPPNGGDPLLPVENLAICTSDGVDGYYLMFCTPDWEYVTYSYDEFMDSTKKAPLIEFGQDVKAWHVKQA